MDERKWPERVERLLKQLDHGVIDEAEARYRIGLYYVDDGMSSEEADEQARKVIAEE